MVVTTELLRVGCLELKTADNWVCLTADWRVAQMAELMDGCLVELRVVLSVFELVATRAENLAEHWACLKAVYWEHMWVAMWADVTAFPLVGDLVDHLVAQKDGPRADVKACRWVWQTAEDWVRLMVAWKDPQTADLMASQKAGYWALGLVETMDNSRAALKDAQKVVQ
jgi:hypothetical protein